MSPQENISPCKRNKLAQEETCKIVNGRCTTCGRTKHDIVTWSSLSKEEQREKIKELQKQGYIE